MVRVRLLPSERTLPGNISAVIRCITALMPKAWAMNMRMAMTRGAMPRWSGRRDSLQCEKAAMAAQQMARSREQLANMLRRLAFLSAAEEQQEVKTRTAPMMTGARRGSRVRPESLKTGAMKTTRVEMPVY